MEYPLISILSYMGIEATVSGTQVYDDTKSIDDYTVLYNNDTDKPDNAVFHQKAAEYIALFEKSNTDNLRYIEYPSSIDLAVSCAKQIRRLVDENPLVGENDDFADCMKKIEDAEIKYPL